VGCLLTRTACTPHRFLPTTMDSLDAAIEAMNLAKEVSKMTLVSAVYGTVGALLTMVRVRLLFCDSEFRLHVHPGFRSQQELCRARTSVCRRMWGT